MGEPKKSEEAEEMEKLVLAAKDPRKEKGEKRGNKC